MSDGSEGSRREKNQTIKWWYACPERDKIYGWTVKTKPMARSRVKIALEKLSKQKLKMVSQVWCDVGLICCCFLWLFLWVISLHQSAYKFIVLLSRRTIARQIADKWRLFTVRSGTTENRMLLSLSLLLLSPTCCVMQCKFRFLCFHTI